MVGGMGGAFFVLSCESSFCCEAMALAVFWWSSAPYKEKRIQAHSCSILVLVEGVAGGSSGGSCVTTMYGIGGCESERT